MSQLECCVCVSNETILQIDRSFTHSDEGLQSETSVKKFFSLRCKMYLFVKLFQKQSNLFVLIRVLVVIMVV